MPAVAVDKLAQRLAEILRGLSDPALQNLAECFLMDEQFMEKFLRAPAGVKNHHAYHGGLVEHVVSLMELSAAVAPPKMIQAAAFSSGLRMFVQFVRLTSSPVGSSPAFTTGIVARFALRMPMKFG